MSQVLILEHGIRNQIAEKCMQNLTDMRVPGGWSPIRTQPRLSGSVRVAGHSSDSGDNEVGGRFIFTPFAAPAWD